MLIFRGVWYRTLIHRRIYLSIQDFFHQYDQSLFRIYQDTVGCFVGAISCTMFGMSALNKLVKLWDKTHEPC